MKRIAILFMLLTVFCGTGEAGYEFVLSWGSQGSGDGQFIRPQSVALDALGNVYVTDYINHRVQKFDSSGNFLMKWGGWGDGDGHFIRPQDITVDASGNVYVADAYNHRVQKFDSSGNFLTKWGSRGSGDGEFDYPRGIAVDASGNIYVLEGGYRGVGNNRIQKIRPPSPPRTDSSSGASTTL